MANRKENSMKKIIIIIIAGIIIMSIVLAVMIFKAKSDNTNLSKNKVTVNKNTVVSIQPKN